MTVPGEHAAGRADAPRSYESETAALLAGRLRGALVLVALSIVLFGLLELRIRQAPGAPFVAVKLVQLATVAIVYRCLRGTPSWRRGVGLGLVAAVEVCLTLAASGALTGEVASAPLLFIVLTMASAALLPWGVGPQLVTAATALVALAANLASVADVPPGFAYVAVAAVLAFVASAWLAYEMDRHRRSLHAALVRLHATAVANGALAHDLAATSHAKSEFLATMSHELRTPLNVILGFAEMAEDEGVAPADRVDLLRRLRTAGHDLLELVENTLDLGRIDAGRDAVRLESLDLRGFWDDVGAACARLPRRAGVALVWSPAPPLVLTTDRRKLTIMIRNLVTNGLKFTERGSIEASVVARRDTVEIRIRDTGIGILPEDRERIFESFTQADGADVRRYDGIGLGLHIVRRFGTSIGATIAVESVRGQGSTFAIVLPARATARIGAEHEDEAVGDAPEPRAAAG